MPHTLTQIEIHFIMPIVVDSSLIKTVVVALFLIRLSPSINKNAWKRDDERERENSGKRENGREREFFLMDINRWILGLYAASAWKLPRCGHLFRNRIDFSIFFVLIECYWMQAIRFSYIKIHLKSLEFGEILWIFRLEYVEYQWIFRIRLNYHT